MRYEYVLNEEQNQVYDVDLAIKLNFSQFYADGNQYDNLLYYMYKGRRNMLTV